MRDGVMSYLYLTRVFFSSLESGAQREKKVSEREQGRGRASRRGKVWSKRFERETVRRDAESRGRLEEEKLTELCQTDRRSTRKTAYQRPAKRPFNAGGLCFVRAIQGEYVFCLMCRKLNSSPEQLSNTYRSVKPYNFWHYTFFLWLNSKCSLYLLNRGASARVHQHCFYTFCTI